MTPTDFADTKSKVKDTLALNVKKVSTDYLENHLSQSLHISIVHWS